MNFILVILAKLLYLAVEPINFIYFISYTREGVDVSHIFKNQSSYDWYINNNEIIQQRDENLEPVLDTEGNFILLPAFDYIMGVFDSMNAISYDVLKVYIVENDNEGKWDLTP